MTLPIVVYTSETARLIMALKRNETNSPTCECGAIEDVQHFLLECPNYHVPRETLRQSLLLSCGIADFDTEILLSVTDDEDLKDIRPLIWDQLDMYITQTKRF